jgi:hypothetical protein
MSRRCNHWECRNSFYQQEAAAKHFFDGGFLLLDQMGQSVIKTALAKAAAK